MQNGAITLIEIINDVEEICVQAMKEKKLHIALKAKELLAKLCLNNQKTQFSLKNLTDEDLEKVINEIKGELL